MELLKTYAPPLVMAPPGFQIPQPPRSPSVGEFLVGAGIAVLAIWGAAELFDAGASTQRSCGVCGGEGHNRRTCPHDGERVGFSRAIPKSSQCECCGSSCYGTERHHTRGRSDPSDFLDVCLDCHIGCCHDGHFQNVGRKPRACRQTGNISAWRNRRALSS